MGCSSSCKTFEIFSTFVEWIAKHKFNIDKLLHLLDDFLFLCTTLCIPIAPEKTCGPATTLTFAGIDLDSIESQAHLPTDKLAKCVDTIASFLNRKKVTLKDLQSLIGLLNFACSVIVPGSTFLRRLIDLTQGIQNPRHFIRLRQAVKEDLKIWQTFLSSFDGISFFLDETWCNSNKLNLFTDISGSIGFGAIFGTEWCYGKRPAHWLHRNIAFLEFYPIVLSLCLWGHKMHNQSILLFTDNEALVHVINKKSCQDK